MDIHGGCPEYACNVPSPPDARENLDQSLPKHPTRSKDRRMSHTLRPSSFFLPSTSPSSYALVPRGGSAVFCFFFLVRKPTPQFPPPWSPSTRPGPTHLTHNITLCHLAPHAPHELTQTTVSQGTQFRFKGARDGERRGHTDGRQGTFHASSCVVLAPVGWLPPMLVCFHHVPSLLLHHKK